MASNNPDTSNQSAASEDAKGDVNAAVEELLNTISNKFAGVSSEIFAKMDEMSRGLIKVVLTSSAFSFRSTLTRRHELFLLFYFLLLTSQTPAPPIS
ncbi:hypothetical protein CGCF413_v005164 [Colletotrichum fructicola]|nr:hypothetical protein CGCF413_v005164 [Colletotrichum fructicola]